jgi:flavin reductase (DIM6/NTAB) family NADH-FMN oxidoreductase RutF
MRHFDRAGGSMDQLAELTRGALRRFAKSVAIITTRWNGQRYAMAASAVVELSLEPPSLLVCVNKTASLAKPLVDGARFAVNLLGKDHAALPACCSAPQHGERRFRLGDWREWESVPILEDAQASFVCTPDSVVPYGTHYVVIGKIDTVRQSGAVDPLIYVDRRYHRAAALE